MHAFCMLYLNVWLGKLPELTESIFQGNTRPLSYHSMDKKKLCTLAEYLSRNIICQFSGQKYLEFFTGNHN